MGFILNFKFPQVEYSISIWLNKSFEMIKFVQGSCHQADLRIGNSAGTQYACCGLVSVSFTLVKSPGIWLSTDYYIVFKHS